MNGDRETVLARIREALRLPGRRSHSHHGPAHAHASAPAGLAGKTLVTAPFRQWLPAVGDSYEERHALFVHQSVALKTEFHDCRDFTAAAAQITALAEAEGWSRIALHRGGLTDALAPLLPKSITLLHTDESYDKNALEACDAGLTECECLVAQTGSICLTSRSSGGRALSVLPPHHIVIARAEQLEPDLSAAYERLAQKYQGSYPSFMTFITGPSRTGDIERILVLGAHGPRRLTVLLVGDAKPNKPKAKKTPAVIESTPAGDDSAAQTSEKRAKTTKKESEVSTKKKATETEEKKPSPRKRKTEESPE